MRLAVGRRPAPDLPEVRWTEVATEAAVLAAVDAGGLDVLVLDGEAVPAGGMGVCKQLKDEIYRCPPVLVLIGRPAGRLAGDLVARRPRRRRTRSTRSRVARGGGRARPPPPRLRGVAR